MSLNLSGTYTEQPGGTRPHSCTTPRQSTIYINTLHISLLCFKQFLHKKIEKRIKLTHDSHIFAKTIIACCNRIGVEDEFLSFLTRLDRF